MPKIRIDDQRRSEAGERLRYWRTRREVSQTAIAHAAKITQGSLSNYETGKRDLPLSTALAIASALDVTLGDLLESTDVIVLRDSRLARAVRVLIERPDVLDSIAPRRVEAEAAS